jgi:hypothetical protein
VESVTKIVTDAVNEIDASDIDTIATKITDMKSKLVNAIKEHLIAVSDAEKASTQEEMKEFNKTIHEILDNATLSPEAIAAKKQLMHDIDERAAAMVEQIQANIAKQNQIDAHRQLITEEAMKAKVYTTKGTMNVDTANTAMDVVANIHPAITNIHPDITNIHPDITNIHPDITSDDANPLKRQRISDNNFSIGGKTRKKINKKTNKKPHKKHNKKSRKQRRSRKH